MLPDPVEEAVEQLAADNLAGLLGEVRRELRRYLVLPGEAEEIALVLFVAHTYALDGAHATPYLLVISPEKRSGKTLLLEVLENLAARPWRVTGTSEAAMFRKIANEEPTLLLDEIDAVFGTAPERTEALRAILNAGNRRGASVARCAGAKMDEVRDFPVFCPKVLAGIDTGSRIPATVRDRSISIRMVRKTSAEPVARFRFRAARAEAENLRQELALWGTAAAEGLHDAEPADIPAILDDRTAEAWEPLLAIADQAGGDWPASARTAATVLSGDEDPDEQSLGGLILEAVQVAFGDESQIRSRDLLKAINEREDLPFGAFRDGGGIDGRGLAKYLKPYRLKKPQTLRFGDDETLKGYRREWFEEAWKRWVPPPLSQPSQASQPSQLSEQITDEPLQQAVVTDVTDVTAVTGVYPL